ncbi:hypothetical protein [Flaviaesturariibacter amylovorans]|uniref:hypothetical protein n=1 Tax=Flaviaesturariibacter amylovorans TaxID=1084520 RepID=UPI0031EBC916
MPLPPVARSPKNDKFFSKPAVPAPALVPAGQRRGFRQQEGRLAAAPYQRTKTAKPKGFLNQYAFPGDFELVGRKRPRHATAQRRDGATIKCKE